MSQNRWISVSWRDGTATVHRRRMNDGRWNKRTYKVTAASLRRIRIMEAQRWSSTI